MVSVAFSDKYFESLLELTPNEQSQATKAVMQFQQDPTWRAALRKANGN